MPDTVTVRAHSKVNPFLRVFARDVTGYHGIETLFSLLELHDTIELRRIESGVTLDRTGPDTGPVEENLAFLAAQTMLELTGQSFGVSIRLHKNIPVQAGLGGASSDCAAVLHSVNLLAGSPVPHNEVIQTGTKLGADVGFLADGIPMALAWGRGERLYRVTPPTSAPVLLVVPEFGISTAKAYEALDRANRSSQRGAVIHDAESFDSWGSIGRLGGNDFETAAFAQHPRLKELFEQLSMTGPLLARMTGSGSTLFGIYRNESSRDDAFDSMKRSDVRLISTNTRPTSADGPQVAE